MRVLTPLICIVLFTALLFSLAVSATQQETLAHWKRSTSNTSPINPKTEKMSNIRLYMPLRNEHLLDLPERNGRPHSNEELRQLATVESSSCLPEKFAKIVDENDDISLRLALWRRILAPSCNTIKAAEKSLRENKLDSLCERRFDHYHCNSLSVETVKTVFGFADSDMHRVEEVYSGLTRISAIVDARKVPAGFSFINNVNVAMNPEMHGRRHERIQQDSASSAKKSSNANKKTSSDNKKDGFTFNPTFLPEYTASPNGAPVIAYYPISSVFALDAASKPSTAIIEKIVFNVYCQDTKNPTVDSTTGAISCPGSTFPSEIELLVLDAGKYPSLTDSLINTTFTIKPSDCVQASNYIIPGPLGGGSPVGTAKSIVCERAMPKVALDYWKPIVLLARSQFAGNSFSDWNADASYYNGDFNLGSTLIPSAGPTQSGMFPDYDPKFILGATMPGHTQDGSDYRKMYNVPANEPATVNPKIAQGVLEFNYSATAPGYLKSDLADYMAFTKDTRFKLENARYVGMDPELGPGGESQLDITLMMSTAPSIPTYFWVFPQGDGSHFGEVIANWADEVVTESGPSMNPRPQTWSISYGSPEQPDVVQYTENMKRAATKIALASSAGITTFVSSGDAGSSSVRTQFIFGPSFPADCPAVVSVGATANRWDYTNNKVRHEPSNSIFGDLITSGGGISTVFPLPSFQKDLYETKIAPLVKNMSVQGPIKPGRLNADVSAMGANILTFIQGHKISVAGTSASSPLVASLMTMWNNRLLQAGLPTMQNANAWVNNNPDAFTDIAAGFDNCAGSGQFANFPMFPVCWRTMTGYDLPTGYGEPAEFDAIANSTAAWQKSNNATPAPGNNNGSPDDDGNKTGEIIGIIFGVAGVITVMAIVWVIYTKNKDSSNAESQQQGGTAINQEHQNNAASGYGAADV